MSERDYIFAKAMRGLDEEMEFIDKGLGTRIGAAGLAGTMALGGGVGAAKAAPRVVDSIRFAGAGNSQNFGNAVANAKRMAIKTGKPQTVNTKNKAGWLKSGRSGGTGWIKGEKTGTYTYRPNGSSSFLAG